MALDNQSPILGPGTAFCTEVQWFEIELPLAGGKFTDHVETEKMKIICLNTCQSNWKKMTKNNSKVPMTRCG